MSRVKPLNFQVNEWSRAHPAPLACLGTKALASFPASSGYLAQNLGSTKEMHTIEE